jgi:hypothetical protein
VLETKDNTMKNRLLKGIVLAIALAASATLANATPIASSDTLANLAANGGSIGIGDKTFSNFDYFPSGLGAGFNPNLVIVTASIQNGIYFLTYSGNMSLTSTGPAASGDLVLNYRVTAGAGTIDYIDQRYAGTATSTGSAFLGIDETVNAGGPTLANSHLDLTDIADFPGFSEPGDNLFLPPGQSFLNVTKDISFGILGVGTIDLTTVEQSFHQVSVPDGGTTLGMLGGALLLLQVLRRKLAA